MILLEFLPESFSKFKTAYKKFLIESEIDSTVFLNQTNLLLLSWPVLLIQPLQIYTYVLGLLFSITLLDFSINDQCFRCFP